MGEGEHGDVIWKHGNETKSSHSSASLRLWTVRVLSVFALARLRERGRGEGKDFAAPHASSICNNSGLISK